MVVDTRGSIILIEDDDAIRQPLERHLRKHGHTVQAFGRGEEAVEEIRSGADVDLVITDLRMPGLDGIGVLRQVKEFDPSIAVLLVTAFGTVESAVEAMRIGADDYQMKPINLLELRNRAGTMIDRRRLSKEVAYLKTRLDRKFGFERIIGRSKGMQELFDQMRLVAPARSSVLIVGESGTGKELIANAIHHHSPRRRQRFIALNCSAIPETLLESELFGHEKGAFTGASQRVVGKFELADRGTLFLDEVGELPREVQVKLLRILEERQFMRVGGSELITIDTRILAATHRDLGELVQEGSFRSDLYYRLKVITLTIPPLRHRRDDIPVLINHFLQQFKQENGRPELRIREEAMHLLADVAWAGNVRELRNLIESLVVMSTKEAIGPDDLPPEYRESAPVPAAGAGGPATMEAIEKQAILRTLEQTGGNRTRAAEILGIGLRTLQRKLKEYGVTGPDG